MTLAYINSRAKPPIGSYIPRGAHMRLTDRSKMADPTRKTSLVLALAIPSLTLLFVTFVLSSSSPSSPTPPATHRRQDLQVVRTQPHAAHYACEGTRYPDLCLSTLATRAALRKKSIPVLIAATVNHTLDEVRRSSSNCSGIRRNLGRDLSVRDRRALTDCLELLSDTLSELTSAASDLSSVNSTARHFHDLQTLLSAAMTNQFTCLDGFAYSDERRHKVREQIKFNLHNISRHVSNSLGMLKKVPRVNADDRRAAREVFPGYGRMKGGFPAWISQKDRKLLQASVNNTRVDIVVAKDGSGNFTTISEAVAAAPKESTTRFVIYIKAGAYFENVEVDKKQTNLMFVGDGIGKTVVKASRNVVDGWTTFRSATVAVVGKGFIARDMTFENSAGPSKHQAVALRSGADLSAFYRCSVVAYQDTLYVHSLRQFYRECDIYGTVDFIFGNAAVVLQNCNLYARKPDPKQKNIYTAQGREDPNQNTGISIINSKVAAAADLVPVQSSFKTYLGRPWKEYSRTVFMTSYIGDLVDPAGWLEWDGDFALKTLYYGEYMNHGPGSNTSGRVKWPGYHVINSSAEASQFTVKAFIQGDEWLGDTGIPFFPNLG